jgi:hypothetical protein
VLAEFAPGKDEEGSMKALRALVLTTVSLTFGTLAALAGQPSGAVTVAPVGTAAPALGTAMLAFLAIALAGIAIVALRRRSAVSTGLTAVALLAAAAVTGYAAASTTIVMGEDCLKETTLEYAPFPDQFLQSQCSNAIKIVDLEVTCFNETLDEIPTQDCAIGLILNLGDVCALPVCDL